MKIKYFISGLILSTCLITTSFAQEKKQAACNDSLIHAELINRNSNWEAQQFIIHTTVQLSMLNDGYTPFIIDAKKGKSYVVNFIPNPKAKGVFLSIIDKDKNELGKLNGKANKTYTLQFTAQYDGQHFVLAKQKIRGSKEVCGGISILEK